MNWKDRVENLFHQVNQLRLELRKNAGTISDTFRPSGHVEAILRYADGPKKGQVYRTIKGRNIVTSTLSGSAPTGGRDVLRRLLIDPSNADSLNGDAYVSRMVLGTNTTQETVSDTLSTMTQVSDSTVDITAVSLDANNPYVTFSATWDQNTANAANISEAGLLGDSVRNDFYARKTFSPFTKTTDFTLQINWTLRS
jgi:hypothetical protein